MLVWFELLIGAPEDLRHEAYNNYAIHILIASPARGIGDEGAPIETDHLQLVNSES